MKRTMAIILALLMLAGCGTALADEYYWDGLSTQWGSYSIWPLIPTADYGAVQQSLREAGRFAVAQEVYVLDHTETRVLTIVEHDDASQLTILHKTEDGQWIVEGGNDTIPIQRFNRNSARWVLHETEEGPVPRDEWYAYYVLDSDQVYDGHYSVELDEVNGQLDGWRGNVLNFQLYLDEDGWFIQSLYLMHEKQEDMNENEGACYFLRQSDNGDWKYEYYEFIDYGDGLERTKDPLYSAVLDGEETMARMRLDAFDYPAIISYLDSLLPDDLPDAHTVPGAVSGRTEADEEQAAAPDQDISGVVVYYNPDGGKYYHSTATCSAVNEQFWPLTGISYDMLNDPSYSRLMPCPVCNPPERPILSDDGANEGNAD